MIAINIGEKASKSWDVRERLVEALKVYLVIKPLQFIYKDFAKKKLEVMKSLPEETLGYDVYKMLNNDNLKIIPKFENHDLKHLILGYGMSSTEEIKMQAYLFGNGNYSIYCILFLSSGILFPNKWSTFYEEFNKGRKAPSIRHLSIDNCMEEHTETIKTIYKLHYKFKI